MDDVNNMELLEATQKLGINDTLYYFIFYFCSQRSFPVLPNRPNSSNL